MIPMPFQKDIENPTADYVPLSSWGQSRLLHFRMKRGIKDDTVDYIWSEQEESQ